MPCCRNDMELHNKGARVFLSVGLLIVIIFSVSGQETLNFLNNYPYNNVYRYQARCSLPCLGTYSPGEFSVTILLDKLCSNFEAFGNFTATQTTPSAVWFLSNTNYINSDSQNQCEFDIQFEHTPQTPVPNGTCNAGWTTPTSCPGLKDSSGVVLNGWMRCFDVVTQQLDACYNQTVFSQCCTACNDYRKTITNCTFGDFQHSQCTSISDEQCYQDSVAGNCCETCHNIANRKSLKVEGCTYGDMDPLGCRAIQSYQCYQDAKKCCESCYRMSNNTNTGCLYGNRVPDTCFSISASDCYNSSIETDCCWTCSILGDVQYPDCLYGDKNTRCISIKRNECYLTSTRDTCCHTCITLADNNHPECAYGDRRDCSGVILDNCQNPTVRNECCQTCSFFEKNNCSGMDQPSCIYIGKSECYDTSTLRDCCSTCLGFYRNSPSHPENCSYGDRTPFTCNLIYKGACYDSEVQFDCCESCPNYISSYLPYDCTYGDKHELCSDISLNPYLCYNRTIENLCCKSCPMNNDTSYPGCEYGDSYASCLATDCASYTKPRLDQCCRTCRFDISTGNTTPFFSTIEHINQTEGNPGIPKHLSTSNKVAPTVGGLVGGVVLVAIIVIASCFIIRRKRSIKKPIKNGLSLSLRGVDSIVGIDHSTNTQNGAVPEHFRAVQGNEEAAIDDAEYDYIKEAHVGTEIIEPMVEKPMERYWAEDTSGYLQPTVGVNPRSTYVNSAFSADEPEKEVEFGGNGINMADGGYLQLS